MNKIVKIKGNVKCWDGASYVVDIYFKSQEESLLLKNPWRPHIYLSPAS